MVCLSLAAVIVDVVCVCACVRGAPCRTQRVCPLLQSVGLLCFIGSVPLCVHRLVVDAVTVCLGRRVWIVC